MQNRADILIIGGGCVGCSIAFWSAKLSPKSRIVLLEKTHIAWGTTGKSTAIIRQHYSNPSTARIALNSLNVFENFSKVVGGDAGFVRTGFLAVTGTEDSEGLRKNVEMQRKVGIETRLVEPAEIEKLQPGANVKDIAVGAYEPRSGYADPIATTKSFATAAERLGVRILEGTKALEITVDKGDVKGVRTETMEIEADKVVNAANVWCNDVMPSNHSKLPIRALREQNCIFSRPPTFKTQLAAWDDLQNRIYLRPEGKNRVLVGSIDPNLPSLENPDQMIEGVDQDTVLAYSEKLSNRFPEMAMGSWKSGFSGAYDVTPDWHPILDESNEVRKLFLAVGFSGHGFKLSPIIGKLMAQLILTGSKPEDLRPFAASRFRDGTLLGGQYAANILG